jgi:predicted ATPase/DNA-binding SARP family transcriptional activator
VGIVVGLEAGREMEPDITVQFRLLGEFQIVSKGLEIKLPPSRKTRALAAYLIATGTPHRRESLCDLLWEGPDDPRGELRWSLAKIRPLLDADGVTRLNSDRSRLGFEARRAVVDAAAARELLTNISSASPETLQTALGLFRGEFLDGLELPACYRFQEWCLAERAALSAMRLNALRALVDRLDDRPEEALVQARALVAADPLSEDGHARVIDLLGRLGRKREALAQYQQASKVIQRETGVRLSGALERARHAVGRSGSEAEDKSQPVKEWEDPGQRPWSEVPLTGRHAEREKIDKLVAAAANARSTPVLLITGEPGIGKSRLLGHLCQRMELIGGRCLRGRAFEAEGAHPFGAWIDAFRTVSAGALPEDVRAHLALLRPELGNALPTDRARLFGAVAALLKHLAAAAPLAVVLDDTQWLDESSAALLHYVARAPHAPEGVLIACAARSGELEDNTATARALQTLTREGRIVELQLQALSQGETVDLVRSMGSDIDATAVFTESDGNPFFAVGLVTGHREGHHQQGRSLQTVIAEQLSTLDEHCRELVTWASALGRTFDPGLLARLTELHSAALLGALERLERRGVVRTVDAHGYEFVHDLVRGAAYQKISQPRRKLMHGQIARILNADLGADDAIAGDLIRHAELAGDHPRAARACVLAGERSLRLFANSDAMTLARRGRSHLAQLPHDELRRELVISLFRIEVLAASGPGLRPLPLVAEELSRAVADAEAAGLHAAAATGHYLLSILHQETGATRQAQQSTLRAAEIGREADSETRAQQLANSARCLIELEVEIPRARGLLAEAGTLLGAGGQSVCELQWGLGLLARWDGEHDEASRRVNDALALAREARDRWREYKCLTWLAVVDLEQGRRNQARDRCKELREVARQLGESDAPLADIFEALADLTETGAHGLDCLDAAFAKLRAVDDKSHLAYALNTAAALCMAGSPQAAMTYAKEALDAGRMMERHCEVAVSEALLTARGTDPQADPDSFLDLVADPQRFNARARALIGRVVESARPSAASKTQKRNSRR